MKYSILLSLITFIVTSLEATHITGGEFYYKKVSDSNYEITLKLKRDCSNADNAQYDASAEIVILKGNTSSVIRKVKLNKLSVTQMQNGVTNSCYNYDYTSICEDIAIFRGLITLADTVNGYDVLYQRCCRNATIQNIEYPDATGYTAKFHTNGTVVFDQKISRNSQIDLPEGIYFYEIIIDAQKKNGKWIRI